MRRIVRMSAAGPLAAPCVSLWRILLPPTHPACASCALRSYAPRMVTVGSSALFVSRSSPRLGTEALVGSVPGCFSGYGNNSGMSGTAAVSGAPLPPPAPLATQGSLRRRSKQEIADQFLANLRARGNLDVDAPGFAEDLRAHFENLPSRWVPLARRQEDGAPPAACLGQHCRAATHFRQGLQPPPPPPPPRRYALDVNINSLDVLNHKRLLDSARSDPSAVSFQLRPVDVVSGSDIAKRPSFGSLDTLQFHHEVRGEEGWGAHGRSQHCLQVLAVVVLTCCWAATTGAGDAAVAVAADRRSLDPAPATGPY